MLLLNINYVPDKEIEAISLVKGTVVYSKNFGKDFMAGMKTLVGGEITGYTEMLTEDILYYRERKFRIVVMAGSKERIKAISEVLFEKGISTTTEETELPENTTVLACGPTPMLRALAAFCKAKNLPLQVSLEARMGCGYGACVGCVVKLDVNGETVQKRVCKDGPVFNGWEVCF